MKAIWLSVLIISSSLLLVTLIRKKDAVRWLGYAALNIGIAAFILYFTNMLGAKLNFHIPINLTTMLTVSVLGLPGYLLLAAIKLAIFM
ncbi:MAG: hypothetical protein A2189_05595 [Paenibacillus sp. RIFOXYA1_FULL_44_5]|nr:MAG: hypothetical protein A2189_05595 [Paenibacillus sp. RIFOXYA1_FULL_44_5]